MTTKVWVLTRSHNDYDQYGHYFETVFSKRPDLETLADYFTGHKWVGLNDPMGAVKFLEHLRKGGGRIGTEDVWFYLNEVETHN